MSLFQNIIYLLEKPKGKCCHTICERCMSGKPARYVVSSDVIHIRVCESCAEEARKLGLTVKPICCGNKEKEAA